MSLKVCRGGRVLPMARPGILPNGVTEHSWPQTFLLLTVLLLCVLVGAWADGTWA